MVAQMSLAVALSPAQEAVVAHGGGDLQVIACAGSGIVSVVGVREEG